MSTSPSWFDQEKFSRLVKKVGPKTLPLPEQASRTPVPEPGAMSAPNPTEAPVPPVPGQMIEVQRPVLPKPSLMTSQSVSLAKIRTTPLSSPTLTPNPENTGLTPAPTFQISHVSKTAALLSESRLLPTLRRRTAPLPALKPLFQYEIPAKSPAPPPLPAAETPRVSQIPKEEKKNFPGSPTESEAASRAHINQASEDLALAWEKITQLNEEIARTIQERNQARNENGLLREQLKQSDEMRQGPEGTNAPQGELARMIQERDEARREYASLREEFETWKRDQGGNKEESGVGKAELEKQIETLRQQIEVKDREINALKEGTGKTELEKQIETLRQQIEVKDREINALKSTPPSSGINSSSATSNEDVAALKEQLRVAKDEASTSQRGLALSQKALQETRIALREASESSSLSKGQVENLKNECATLVQQNMLLQAQHDQLSRELSSVRAKLTSKV